MVAGDGQSGIWPNHSNEWQKKAGSAKQILPFSYLEKSAATDHRSHLLGNHIMNLDNSNAPILALFAH
jgi:hypothetical protein